jgi:hypothetical protein
MDELDINEWCSILETTFLQYNWTEHTKKYTYTERTGVNPKTIENILLSYSRGENHFIKELNGNRPHIKCVLHLILKLVTVL